MREWWKWWICLITQEFEKFLKKMGKQPKSTLKASKPLKGKIYFKPTEFLIKINVFNVGVYGI